MVKISTALLILSAIALILPSASAFGYGTSSITISPTTVHLNPNGNVAFNYTVNLASGSTWGTTLVDNNVSQLANQGINIQLSNPSGNPPFSGTATISAYTTARTGTYRAVFSATGDDPSTSNVTLTIDVGPTAPTTPPASNTTTSTNSTTTSNKTTSTTTTNTTTNKTVTPVVTNNNSGSNSGSTSYPTAASSANNSMIMLIIGIIVMLIIAAYLMMIMKSMSTRLVVFGVLLILVGTVVWLYGDYGGGEQYVWPGVIAILVGTIAWVYGDYIAGAFKRSGK